jgi:hypothetical protein
VLGRQLWEGGIQGWQAAERLPTQYGFRAWLSLFIVVSLLTAGCGFRSGDWRTASREPAGIAPDPQTAPEAVLQVYGAPAYGWRGWFGIHTWISAKGSGEGQYTVYEVIGWRKRRGLPVVRIARDYPDRYWFGERPRLLLDRRGEGVDALIAQVDAAARAYPWADTYRVWPGPNSNTFTAWVARNVPEMGLELPFSAIGKGWGE